MSAPADKLVDVACVKPLSCTVLVGSTEFGYGPGRLNYPQSMCQPDANTLLIADRSNNRIRKLDLRTMQLSNFAGSGEVFASPEDEAFFDAYGVAVPKEKARLVQPSAICEDPRAQGTFYVATDDNPQRVLRSINQKGQAHVVAGQDYFIEPTPEEPDDFDEWFDLCIVPKAKAREACFSDIAFMVPGTLAGRSEPELILSSTNSHVVRAFNPRTNEVRVVAGNGLRGSHVVQALMDPFGLAVDSKGRLLISCLEGYTILRFDESAPKNKQLDCIAGSNARIAYRDGMGTEALLGNTAGLCVDQYDNVYFCDYTNNAIRAISPEGYVYSLVAPESTKHTEVAFDFSSPFSVLYDKFSAARGSPRLFVIDLHRVLQIELDPVSLNPAHARRAPRLARSKTIASMPSFAPPPTLKKQLSTIHDDYETSPPVSARSRRSNDSSSPPISARRGRQSPRGADPADDAPPPPAFDAPPPPMFNAPPPPNKKNGGPDASKPTTPKGADKSGPPSSKASTPKAPPPAPARPKPVQSPAPAPATEPVKPQPSSEPPQEAPVTPAPAPPAQSKNAEPAPEAPTATDSAPETVNPASEQAPAGSDQTATDDNEEADEQPRHRAPPPTEAVPAQSCAPSSDESGSAESPQGSSKMANPGESTDPSSIPPSGTEGNPSSAGSPATSSGSAPSGASQPKQKKWELAFDESGEPYWFDQDGNSTWDDPQLTAAAEQQAATSESTTTSSGLPYPWEAVVDEETGDTYYFNPDSGDSTWDLSDIVPGATSSSAPVEGLPTVEEPGSKPIDLDYYPYDTENGSSPRPQRSAALLSDIQNFKPAAASGASTAAIPTKPASPRSSLLRDIRDAPLKRQAEPVINEPKGLLGEIAMAADRAQPEAQTTAAPSLNSDLLRDIRSGASLKSVAAPSQSVSNSSSQSTQASAEPATNSTVDSTSTAAQSKKQKRQAAAKALANAAANEDAKRLNAERTAIDASFQPSESSTAPASDEMSSISKDIIKSKRNGRRMSAKDSMSNAVSQLHKMRSQPNSKHACGCSDEIAPPGTSKSQGRWQQAQQKRQQAESELAAQKAAADAAMQHQRELEQKAAEQRVAAERAARQAELDRLAAEEAAALQAQRDEEAAQAARTAALLAQARAEQEALIAKRAEEFERYQQRQQQAAAAAREQEAALARAAEEELSKQTQPAVETAQHISTDTTQETDVEPIAKSIGAMPTEVQSSFNTAEVSDGESDEPVVPKSIGEIPTSVHSAAPEEIPAASVVETTTADPWVELVDDATGSKYFFNPQTNETSWTHPRDAVPATQSAVVSTNQTPLPSPWISLFTDDKKEYFYNPETQVTTWERPQQRSPLHPWTEYIDEASGRPYYVNTETQETSWNHPHKPVAATASESESTRPPPPFALLSEIQQGKQLRPTQMQPAKPSEADLRSALLSAIRGQQKLSAPVVQPPTSSAAREQLLKDIRKAALKSEPKTETESQQETEAEPVQVKSIGEEPTSVHSAAPVESVEPVSAPADKSDVQWVELVDGATGSKYFFNPKTNETSWTIPNQSVAEAVPNSLPSPWISLFTDDKQEYFYNPETQVTTWDRPVAESQRGPLYPWTEYIDEASGRPYYVNSETQATSWDHPHKPATTSSESEPARPPPPSALLSEIQQGKQLRPARPALPSESDLRSALLAAIRGQQKPSAPVVQPPSSSAAREQLLKDIRKAALKSEPSTETESHQETEAEPVQVKSIGEEPTSVHSAAPVESVEPVSVPDVEEAPATEPVTVPSLPVVEDSAVVEDTTPSDTQLETEVESPLKSVGESPTEVNAEAPMTKNSILTDLDPTSDWYLAIGPDNESYFFNSATNESAWELPAGSKLASDIPYPWSDAKDENGDVYYFNELTGETSWNRPTVSLPKLVDSDDEPTQPEQPISKPASEPAVQVPVAPVTPVAPAVSDDELWEALIDPDSGEIYYENVKTGETTWDLLPHMKLLPEPPKAPVPLYVDPVSQTCVESAKPVEVPAAIENATQPAVEDSHSARPVDVQPESQKSTAPETTVPESVVPETVATESVVSESIAPEPTAAQPIESETVAPQEAPSVAEKAVTSESVTSEAVEPPTQEPEIVQSASVEPDSATIEPVAPATQEHEAYSSEVAVPAAEPTTTEAIPVETTELAVEPESIAEEGDDTHAEPLLKSFGVEQTANFAAPPSVEEPIQSQNDNTQSVEEVSDVAKPSTDDELWDELIDPESGHTFYESLKTGQTTWDYVPTMKLNPLQAASTASAAQPAPQIAVESVQPVELPVVVESIPVVDETQSTSPVVNAVAANVEPADDVEELWETLIDQETGFPYYESLKTGETTWVLLPTMKLDPKSVLPEEVVIEDVAGVTEEPLEEVWEQLVEPETGEVYYESLATGETTWERKPDMAVVPAEELWESLIDPETGDIYYESTITGETTWDLLPTMKVKPGEPVLGTSSNQPPQITSVELSMPVKSIAVEPTSASSAPQEPQQPDEVETDLPAMNAMPEPEQTCQFSAPSHPVEPVQQASEVQTEPGTVQAKTQTILPTEPVSSQSSSHSDAASASAAAAAASAAAAAASAAAAAASIAATLAAMQSRQSAQSEPDSVLEQTPAVSEVAPRTTKPKDHFRKLSLLSAELAQDTESIVEPAKVEQVVAKSVISEPMPTAQIAEAIPAAPTPASDTAQLVPEPVVVPVVTAPITAEPDTVPQSTEEELWIEWTDPNTGDKYYESMSTGETTWDLLPTMKLAPQKSTVESTPVEMVQEATSTEAAPKVILSEPTSKFSAPIGAEEEVETINTEVKSFAAEPASVHSAASAESAEPAEPVVDVVDKADVAPSAASVESSQPIAVPDAEVHPVSFASEHVAQPVQNESTPIQSSLASAAEVPQPSEVASTEQPAEELWIEWTDPNTGDKYYESISTGETTWDLLPTMKLAPQKSTAESTPAEVVPEATSSEALPVVSAQADEPETTQTVNSFAAVPTSVHSSAPTETNQVEESQSPLAEEVSKTEQLLVAPVQETATIEEPVQIEQSDATAVASDDIAVVESQSTEVEEAAPIKSFVAPTEVHLAAPAEPISDNTAVDNVVVVDHVELEPVAEIAPVTEVKVVESESIPASIPELIQSSASSEAKTDSSPEQIAVTVPVTVALPIVDELVAQPSQNEAEKPESETAAEPTVEPVVVAVETEVEPAVKTMSVEPTTAFSAPSDATSPADTVIESVAEVTNVETQQPTSETSESIEHTSAFEPLIEAAVAESANDDDDMWEVLVDPSSGKTYYESIKHGITTWDLHPSMKLMNQPAVAHAEPVSVSSEPVVETIASDSAVAAVDVTSPISCKSPASILSPSGRPKMPKQFSFSDKNEVAEFVPEPPEPEEDRGPSDADWIQLVDPNTKHCYWENARTGVTQWDDPRECQDPVEVEEAIFEDDPELLAITKLNTLHNTGTVPVVTADGEPVLTETWSALVDPDSGYTYYASSKGVTTWEWNADMNLPAPSEDEAVPSEEILSETKVIAETPIMVATEAPAEAPEPVKHVPTPFAIVITTPEAAVIPAFQLPTQPVQKPEEKRAESPVRTTSPFRIVISPPTTPVAVAPATPVTPPATTSPVKITLEIGIQTEPFDQTQDVVDEPAVVKTMSFEVTEKHAAMHVLEEPATSILEQAEPAEQVPVQTTATVVPADSVVVAVADARSEVSTDADHTRSSPVQQLNAENDDQHTWIKQTDPTSGDTYYECLETGEASWEHPSMFAESPSHSEHDPAKPRQPRIAYRRIYKRQTGPRTLMRRIYQKSVPAPTPSTWPLEAMPVAEDEPLSMDVADEPPTPPEPEPVPEPEPEVKHEPKKITRVSHSQSKQQGPSMTSIALMQSSGAPAPARALLAHSRLPASVAQNARVAEVPKPEVIPEPVPEPAPKVLRKKTVERRVPLVSTATPRRQ